MTKSVASTALMKAVMAALVCFGLSAGVSAGVCAFQDVQPQPQPLGDKAMGSQGKLGASGLPLPRFVSTSNSTSNMRTGPSRTYPISWVYKLEDYPLEVIDEFGPWRKVRGVDGTTGWMFVKILTGTRTALIMGATRPLRKTEDPTSPVTIRAEAGVIGLVKSCTKSQCQLDIAGSKGWINKAHLYGVYRDEIF